MKSGRNCDRRRGCGTCRGFCWSARCCARRPTPARHYGQGDLATHLCLETRGTPGPGAAHALEQLGGGPHAVVKTIEEARHVPPVQATRVGGTGVATQGGRCERAVNVSERVGVAGLQALQLGTHLVGQRDAVSDRHQVLAGARQGAQRPCCVRVRNESAEAVAQLAVTIQAISMDRREARVSSRSFARVSDARALWAAADTAKDDQ